MMNYEEFVRAFKEMAKGFSGDDMEITFITSTKTNLGTGEAVVLRHSGNPMAPTLRLDLVYRDYQEGLSFEKVFDKTIRTLKAATEQIPVKTDRAVNMFKDTDSVLNNAVAILIPQKGNEDFARENVCIPWLDLYISIRVAVETAEEDTMASAPLRRDIFAGFNVPESKLLERAISNSEKMLPVHMENLHHMVAEMMRTYGVDEEFANDMLRDDSMIPMIIVTNTKKINGASVILYKSSPVRDAAEKCGCNLYILPSSRHECILVPELDGEFDAGSLRDMVKQVNETELPPEDFLSDSVYYYDRETGEISIVGSEEE